MKFTSKAIPLVLLVAYILASFMLRESKLGLLLSTLVFVLVSTIFMTIMRSKKKIK